MMPPPQMSPEAFRELAGLVQGVIVCSMFVLVAYSPIARAIGNRILHGKLPPGGARDDDQRVDQISGEVAAMRHNLNEALERIDFAERMLAQSRERQQLGGGKDE
jgi:hypothetical protein